MLCYVMLCYVMYYFQNKSAWFTFLLWSYTHNSLNLFNLHRRTILLQGQGFSQKVPLQYGWTLEDLFVSLIANQVTTSRFYSSDQWWTRWTWWMLYLGQLKRCSKVEMQLSTWQLLHHSWTALLQNQLFPRTHHTMQCPSQHCPQK